MSGEQPYLICYDITCPRRLGKVRRLLCRHGVPVQYSVFAASLTPSGLETVLAGLAALIEPSSDDVRVYSYRIGTFVDFLGRGYLPDGVLAGGMGIGSGAKPNGYAPDG
jgi:CRISPR-associated protein Cas2